MPEQRDRNERKGLRALLDRVRGRFAIDPARRKLYLRLGAIALALTVFVIAPAYMGAQPGFMKRYPNMEASHDTWETSVHAKVSCQTCHVEPDFAAQAKYNVQMLGEFYVSLVARSREPDLLARPTNEACSSCHIDLRTVSPSGDLNIPHRAHVDVLGIDCVECHEFLVHELSPEGKHVPRMIACLDCHDGEQAKDACVVCHTEKAAPENHGTAEWLIVHPQMQDSEDCESCHGWTPDWCVECHTRRPSSHVERWRTVHRDTVEVRRNCEACHEADFCIRCHGEVPLLNWDPDLALVE